MENPIKMDDLGAHPYLWKHPYIDNVIKGSVVVQTPKITSNYPLGRSDILGFEFLNMKDTLPETNSKVAPENGWLEYDPFLLGPGLFSGANC